MKFRILVSLLGAVMWHGTAAAEAEVNFLGYAALGEIKINVATDAAPNRSMTGTLRLARRMTPFRIWNYRGQLSQSDSPALPYFLTRIVVTRLGAELAPFWTIKLPAGIAELAEVIFEIEESVEMGTYHMADPAGGTYMSGHSLSRKTPIVGTWKQADGAQTSMTLSEAVQFKRDQISCPTALCRLLWFRHWARPW